MDNSTSAVLWCTNGTLTRATGSLLLERLAPSTGNLSTVLRGVRSLTGGRELCDNNLVNEVDVGFDCEKRVGKLNRACLLSSCVNDGYLRHNP
ncbi:unannotated protein [freshwater metagenome]|uniref:Unannotated protein n=1 Tax=freshwater metagenome TaxID=449393 RepID=A0A6J6G0D0_9ZZZZ